VSIRGTMDLRDCLADVICNYDSFTENDKEIKCHKGMNQCAANKLLHVEEHVLQALQLHPGYDVAFTGHSLGAGTAGLLAVRFKNKHPQLNVTAWLYGCPPILDKDSAILARDWITSFVNRDDVIPRLTYGSLYDLKAMIQEVLKENTHLSQRVWQVVSAGGNMPKVVSNKMNTTVGHSGINIQKIKRT